MMYVPASQEMLIEARMKSRLLHTIVSSLTIGKSAPDTPVLQHYISILASFPTTVRKNDFMHHIMEFERYAYHPEHPSSAHKIVLIHLRSYLALIATNRGFAHASMLRTDVSEPRISPFLEKQQTEVNHHCMQASEVFASTLLTLLIQHISDMPEE